MPNLRRHLSSRKGFVNTTTSPHKVCLRLRFIYRYVARDDQTLRGMHFKFMSHKVWVDWLSPREGEDDRAYWSLEVRDREGYKLLLGVIEKDGPIEPVIDWVMDKFPGLAPYVAAYVEAANERTA